MSHGRTPGAGATGVTIVGCGYTGRRLARTCLAAGRDVLGLVASPASHAALEEAGIPAARLDLDAPGPALPSAWSAERALVYMVPPPDDGLDDPRMAAFLARLADPPGALVYLSTTGVYGDTGGAAVDEDSPVEPVAARSRRRRAAERRALDWGEAYQVPVRVLRVPAIYGPGRLPLARIREGAPVPRADQAGPGNRIHVDDLAAVCLAAAEYAGEERVFNVGDGEHASITAYFRAVAAAAGLAPPPELPMDALLAQVSPGLASFLVESRRVATRRMREVLGFTPRYGLADGIAASLADASD